MSRHLLFSRLKAFVITMLWVYVASVAFGATLNQEIRLANALNSSISATVMGGPIILWEFLYVTTPLGAAFRKKPFLLFFGIRLAVWTAWITIASYIANHFVWGMPAATLHLQADFWWTILFAFAVGTIVATVLALDQLLGQGILASFLSGRYHSPRNEERAFLFVDLVGSTAAAERIGPVLFMELLDRFIGDVDAALDRSGGRIERYIGDEVIISWRLERGTDPRLAVDMVIRLGARLVGQAGDYQRRFGIVPKFRAALHSGTVVAGEIGDRKREIVLLGDTLNTTARMEQACRDVDQTFLISEAALAHVGNKVGLEIETLGPLNLRGKTEPVPVAAIAVPMPTAQDTGDQSARQTAA